MLSLFNLLKLQFLHLWNEKTNIHDISVSSKTHLLTEAEKTGVNSSRSHKISDLLPPNPIMFLLQPSRLEREKMESLLWTLVQFVPYQGFPQRTYLSENPSSNNGNMREGFPRHTIIYSVVLCNSLGFIFRPFDTHHLISSTHNHDRNTGWGFYLHLVSTSILPPFLPPFRRFIHSSTDLFIQLFLC